MPPAKITDADADAMLLLTEQGRPQAYLADRFGCAQSVVSKHVARARERAAIPAQVAAAEAQAEVSRTRPKRDSPAPTPSTTPEPDAPPRAVERRGGHRTGTPESTTYSGGGKSGAGVWRHDLFEAWMGGGSRSQEDYMKEKERERALLKSRSQIRNTTEPFLLAASDDEYAQWARDHDLPLPPTDIQDAKSAQRLQMNFPCDQCDTTWPTLDAQRYHAEFEHATTEDALHRV